MLRTVALGAALLGGMTWVLNLFVDTDGLSVLGVVLLGVAVFLAGTTLVRQAWLAVVSGLGSAALLWSLLELLRAHADDRVLEGAIGGVASLVVAILVARGPGPARSSAPTARADAPGRRRARE